MLVFLLFMFMFSVVGVQLFKGAYSYCNDRMMKTELQCQGTFVQYEVSFPLNFLFSIESGYYTATFFGPKILCPIIYLKRKPLKLELIMRAAPDKKGWSLSPCYPLSPLCVLFILCVSFSRTEQRISRVVLWSTVNGTLTTSTSTIFFKHFSLCLSL